MELNIFIRKETKDDADAKSAVMVAAFETLVISSRTDQFVVEDLYSAIKMSKCSIR